jgi:hypothetical protein
MTVQIEVREETAAKLQAIANAMQLSLDDYLAKIATHIPPQTSPSPLSDDPAFTMAFRDYLSLSAAEHRAVALDLQERNRGWLKRQMELHRAAWIMVIGGQVVESSPRLDDYPTPERLMKLGTEHDLIPFVFSRPPLFDEISWRRDQFPEDFFDHLRSMLNIRTLAIVTASQKTLEAVSH